MFKALQPLLTERSIHILLSPAKDGKVGVYVEPVKLDDKEDNAFITPSVAKAPRKNSMPNCRVSWPNG